MAKSNVKHPPGLFILFYAEMWDRLGYYGIQSILVLYLIHQFQFSDNLTYGLFGVFTTLAFTTPLIGGIIADRLLGYQRAIITGLFLLITGNSLLLLKTQMALYLGFTLVVWGVGFFKASNVTLLGRLYPPEDVRRESAFTILYMGMNLGAILGPVLFGVLILEYNNWHSGYLINLGGFLTSLCLYLGSYGYFKKHDRLSTNNHQLKSSELGLKKFLGFILILATVVFFTVILFDYPDLFKVVIWCGIALTIIAVAVIVLMQQDIYRKRVLLLFVLDIFAIFYFSCSLQLGSSLTLFIDRYVNRHFFGCEIPTATFSALQPAFIILVTPLIVPLWTYLERKRQAPSLILQINFSLLLAAISFVFFTLATRVSIWQGINLPFWAIILGNLGLAIGELCIGPSLMGAPSQLLPQRWHGTFVGFYFLTNAFSAYIGSLLAKLTVTPTAGVGSYVNEMSYFVAFSKITFIAFLGWFICLFMMPWLRRLLRNSVIEPKNFQNHADC